MQKVFNDNGNDLHLYSAVYPLGSQSALYICG